MRTVFVNPTRRRRRRHKRRNVSLALAPRRNPRRRRRHYGARRRRRNAGITPFIRNPLILHNPRRRRGRSRRRNPGFSLGRLDFKSIIGKVTTYGGGAAIGAAVNIYGINKIENTWLRNGARLLAAVAGSALVKGEMGAAMAGAVLYPTIQEIATMLLAPEGAESGTATEADLDSLAADLEDVLDDVDGGGMSADLF